MNCPHCGIAFYAHWAIGLFYRGKTPVEANAIFPNAFWKYKVVECPDCREVVIDVGVGQMYAADSRFPMTPSAEAAWERVRPIAPERVVQARMFRQQLLLTIWKHAGR